MSLSRAHLCTAVFLLAGLVARAAAAQTLEEPDITNARLRLGPLALSPTLELTNLGIDTNVFNDPDGQAKRDFTFTVTPKTEFWMRAGRTWLTGNLREDIVWYQEYSTERTGNHAAALAWMVPLNRLRFKVSGSYANGRERPGFEIDARSPRKELLSQGWAELRTLARTYVGVRGSRQIVDFAQDAVFLGSSLQQELNRSVTGAAITVRQQLTPLTALTFDVGREEDRFDFSPLRDSDSTIAGVQVTFDPLALIKGSARFGYRDFQPVSPGLAAYQGTTAAADLTYTLLGTTRFTVQVGRDIQFSYDVEQPYYLQTGVAGSIAQQLFGPVDVVARAATHNLAYRERTDGVAPPVNRTDRVRLYGGGLGYHLGQELRVGVNIEKQRRVSDVANRAYEGLRVGTSLTYGF